MESLCGMWKQKWKKIFHLLCADLSLATTEALLYETTCANTQVSLKVIVPIYPGFVHITAEFYTPSVDCCLRLVPVLFFQQIIDGICDVFHSLLFEKFIIRRRMPSRRMMVRSWESREDWISTSFMKDKSRGKYIVTGGTLGRKKKAHEQHRHSPAPDRGYSTLHPPGYSCFL